MHKWCGREELSGVSLLLGKSYLEYPSFLVKQKKYTVVQAVVHSRAGQHGKP